MQVLDRETLNRLKAVELEILKQFVSVCEKMKLKYYLTYGTLLGAIRHQGFIPWDDDIDVAMPRRDYEIFLEKGQAFLPEYYFLQNGKTDPEWLGNFSKIRDSRTTFIETSVKHANINHGVFIDIFPLDFYPETEKKRRRFNKRNKFLKRNISKGYFVKRKGFRKFTWWAFCLLTLPLTKKKAALKRESLLKETENSSYYISASGAWGNREIAPIEWYGDGARVEFEGLSLLAPSEYDKWLTHVYGDYMQLPPEEKRVGHHYTEKIDLNKSYL